MHTIVKRAKSTRHERLPGRKVRFSVRSYPFYYMHAIITKNNRNIGEALKPIKLTPAIWRILALLQEQDGITISELADESLIERTLLGRILQGMERRGLVFLREDNNDRRRVVVYLSVNGIKTFERILPIGRRQIERAIRGLPKRELEHLIAILRHITRNVDSLIDQ